MEVWKEKMKRSLWLSFAKEGDLLDPNLKSFSLKINDVPKDTLLLG
jgi:hypothetical protein